MSSNYLEVGEYVHCLIHHEDIPRDEFMEHVKENPPGKATPCGEECWRSSKVVGKKWMPPETLTFTAKDAPRMCHICRRVVLLGKTESGEKICQRCYEGLWDIYRAPGGTEV